LLCARQLTCAPSLESTRLRDILQLINKHVTQKLQRVFTPLPLSPSTLMTLPASRPVLQRHLLDPSSLQVSCYCLPRNVKDKSVEELRELRELGLKEVYIGCESGDNEVGANAHLRA